MAFVPQEIPQGLTAMCEVARRPENKLRNRYGNIVAYDHTRVKLMEEDPETGSDYINANFIDAYKMPSAFIATQGPSKATLSDIWQMAWEQNSHRIIMVANLVEDGRHKCEQYWPEAGKKSYGSMTVESMDSEQYADFVVRTFTISKGDVSKTLRQFHFTAWPDHGVPTHATSLLEFRRKVRSYDDLSAGPSVIHCSAGVGRTGTFLALDFLLDQAKAEQQVDIYGCVRKMRKKRVNMVQTVEQYVFVYEALLEALKSGDTSIPCVDFRKRYNDLLKKNPETEKTFLEEEYELLAGLAPSSATNVCREASSAENAPKNRFPDIVPDNKLARPYIMPFGSGSSDYINAVFTDGYKQRDGFIITQTPLPSTVVDLWSLIHSHDCKTIVMLHPHNPADKTEGLYFPNEVASKSFAPFTVDTIAVDSSHPDITVRDISLSLNKRGNSETKQIRQFHFHGWKASDDLPTSKSVIISLLQLIEKWQQRSGNGVIVVHCMDGLTRSGLFCAISYMVERLKVEQEVDVFQSVKHTRMNRPKLIPNLTQYQFVYDMAVEYMDCFETYANFK
ncbi:hypothetical protein CAPTEDRAFT_173573 [Capitella teleta]|uniref:protein-tyrosine-phosphatase n=1 Tax=Capitella teleta TaxID=283909 RepID=X1ZD53_CAPTE|nr:hypothetical protein CAPTEDRAFT_173573 [Capitella teleta]|eukprot:ELU04626.1 hypothetical protein CAPTEDRAFT_173573 [Capitella teleta]